MMKFVLIWEVSGQRCEIQARTKTQCSPVVHTLEAGLLAEGCTPWKDVEERSSAYIIIQSLISDALRLRVCYLPSEYRKHGLLYADVQSHAAAHPTQLMRS